MSYERFQVKNLAYATLISDNTSTLDIASDLHYSLPTDTSSGTFTICIDDELLKVTDVNWDGTGNYIFDVIRAQEDTTSTTHLMGQKVYLNVTAGNINNIQDYISLIDTSSNVDLNSMEAAIALNSAKVTNANHTGDVTGADVLGIVPSAISGRSEVTPASGDYVLLWDATDSTLKKSLVDTFITGGGGGDVTGPSSSTNLGLAIFDGTSGKLLKNSTIIVDTSSNVVNETGGLHLTTAARYLNQQALSTSGAVSWNIRQYPSANIILSGDVTSMTISEIAVNTEAVLYVKQHASSAKSITWDSNIKWSGGYTPDISTLGSVNVFSFFSYDGTGLIGSFVNDDYRTSGLIHVQDNTGNIYYIGEDATGKKSSWISGATTTAVQIGENLGIYSSANLSEILNGAYVDSTGSYRYSSTTSTDKAIRLSFNETSNDLELYFSTDTTSTHDDYVTFKKGYQIGADNFSMRDSTGGLRINLDSTAGNITTLGTVNGRNMTTDGSKLDTIATGADVSPVTLTNTVTLENKRIKTRVSTLTDSTSIAINTDNMDCGKVTLGGNRTLAVPTGTANDCQILQLQVSQDATGGRTLTFIDTTSVGGWRVNSDMTGIVLSTAANKKDLLLFEYLSDVTGWCYLSIVKGI